MKKFVYQLILNKGKIVSGPVIASFGNNHRIELHICASGALISAFSSAQKEPEDILNGNDTLFADALKKTLLLYVIRYNRFLSITKAVVTIDGIKRAEYSMNDMGLPLVYSLSNGKLRELFASEWNAASIKSVIACTSNSSYDGRFSALHALLAAKSDRYEIERFTYYWMAMNGLYNYIAAAGEKQAAASGIKLPVGGDAQKQDFMLRSLGYEPVCPSGIKQEKNLHCKRIMWHILPVIRSISLDHIDEFCSACLSSDETDEYIQKIFSAINRMNEKYGYQEQYQVFPLMVVWLPYKIRCGSFHGENALPTFCYSDDNLLRALRVINRLLDRFLTGQLSFWLDSDKRVIEERQRRLEKAVMNPVYKPQR